MAKMNIILRTDAGKVLGRFATVRAARTYSEALSAEVLKTVLVIATADGAVLARRFPS